VPVLLLRLSGPLQSWGTSSRFLVRDTAAEPSKSGVIGLLCAACGVPRDDDETVARLATLRLGVRVEREGVPLTDFQTVGGGRLPDGPYGVATAGGERGKTVLSPRHYLTGAEFLVGLESDEEAWLVALDHALRHPVWPLYLGRRSCPPGVPPPLGVSGGDLADVLTEWPWSSVNSRETTVGGGVRLVVESDDPADEPRLDCPVSFRSEDRRYRLRRVRTTWLATDQLRKEGTPFI
jgi:CRISPR system Cascade subunit CasD